jgi:hypothetical protein
VQIEHWAEEVSHKKMVRKRMKNNMERIFFTRETKLNFLPEALV